MKRRRFSHDFTYFTDFNFQSVTSFAKSHSMFIILGRLFIEQILSPSWKMEGIRSSMRRPNLLYVPGCVSNLWFCLIWLDFDDNLRGCSSALALLSKVKTKHTCLFIDRTQDVPDYSFWSLSLQNHTAFWSNLKRFFILSILSLTLRIAKYDSCTYFLLLVNLWQFFCSSSSLNRVGVISDLLIILSILSAGW